MAAILKIDNRYTSATVWPNDHIDLTHPISS